MTHGEFVAAYREGKVAVQVDAKAAAQLVSARTMLPLVVLPVFGLAVALALTGYLIVGTILFVAALAFRYAVRRSSPGFVIKRALDSPDFYADAVKNGLLRTGKQP
jgi:hypothetical protein